ncbi:hypothetical protein NDU88_005289 [Pleurodeles waltl]|uniref:Uncharacterized protein n=1 Tax=Pleurodeles waltl TaxID=8319 RepID=A0AAV7L0D1_PLEWA|nr:hypothetical protein NDU88_005289 [Pleurodeles waltl]
MCTGCETYSVLLGQLARPIRHSLRTGPPHAATRAVSPSEVRGGGESDPSPLCDSVCVADRYAALYCSHCMWAPGAQHGIPRAAAPGGAGTTAVQPPQLPEHSSSRRPQRARAALGSVAIFQRQGEAAVDGSGFIRAPTRPSPATAAPDKP